MTEYNYRHLCKHCGRRFGKHGSSDNPYRPFACPGSDKEPGWPKMGSWSLEIEEIEGRIFDSRMARHWTKLNTSFEPVE